MSFQQATVEGGFLRPFSQKLVFVSLVVLTSQTMGAPPEQQWGDFGSQPKEWEFYGGTPDRRVENWIKFVILTARERPLPIVFFSTQQFDLMGRPEQLIILRELEYSRLAKFTRNQTCVNPEAKPKDMEPGTSRVTMHHDHHTRSCVLNQPAACDYLVAIATMPNIHLNAAQLNPIRDLTVAMSCKNLLPDDANVNTSPDH